jgi:hypothetical protein
MKSILIPTDFTISSLRLISAATEHFKGQRLQIHLIHALEPEDSIAGLLFINRRLRLHSLYDDTFLQACEIIRNKYASVISKISIAFYLGGSENSKNNFLNARGMDAIVLPINYSYKNDFSVNSLDPVGLWENTSLPVIYLSLPEYKPALASMENTMAVLLNF